jgi:hypothetical protein
VAERQVEEELEAIRGLRSAIEATHDRAANEKATNPASSGGLLLNP